MATFPINVVLSSSSTGIVELCNVGRELNKLKANFPPEYWLDCNIILEALDCASNLSLATMASAPFPGIDISDTQADKASKVADIWRAYPKVGLQIYFDSGNGQYQKKGQPIVIQNTPVQFPMPLISPYLNATAAVFLMGESSRLAIQVINDATNNWQSIKGSDFITITGALRFDIQARELSAVPIRNWLSISSNLPNNQLIKILPNKSNRRYLTVQNAGTTNIFCGFGSDIAANKGNLLTPNGGSLNLDSERYYTESEFWAISPEGEGLIVGQEGLL